MATVNEKMTALADEIRELSGTTTAKSINAMATDVNAANTEITEQTDLILQIVSALDGKASGSSGEDVTAETNTYTSLASQLETTINNLPTAGSGGSNVQYEIITISEGATSATYTLPRVTNAYGSIANWAELSSNSDHNAIVGIKNDLVYYLLRLYGEERRPNDYYTEVSIDSVVIHYNNGVITWDDGAVLEPVELVLINDPNKNPLSTCTPST